MPNQNYPSFGLSTWPWTALKQGDKISARDFYNVWTNFSTEKDFSWMEQWNLAEAPERRVRRYIRGSSLLAFLSDSWSRLMEKDNKKQRDDARKEYNETIRVSFKFNSSSS